MSERYAAEAIGWKMVHNNDPWNGPLWLLPDDTGRWGEPTVDDMLAWLLAKNFTSFHFGAQGGGFYVDWGDDATHGSTLHEALSSAVLAVADREGR